MKWWKRKTAQDEIKLHTQRETLCAEILADLLSPEEPAILGGRWSWFRLPGEREGRRISIVYPELGLCVQVHPPDVVRDITVESANPGTRAAQYLRTLCQAQNISLIEIFSSTEITTERISAALDSLGI